MRWVGVALMALLPTDAVAEPVSAELELDCPLGRRTFPPSEVRMAWNGSSYLAVTLPEYGSDIDVYGRRMDATGQPIDRLPFPIIERPKDQQARVASIGGDFLVVWQDEARSAFDTNEIRATRVTADGSIVNPEGTLIASGSLLGAGVVASASVYLIVWYSYTGGLTVYGARVGTDGTLLDADPFVIAQNAQRTAFASNGSEFLAVFEQPGQMQDLVAVRIGSDGIVLDTTPRVIAASPANDEAPAVAFGGGQYLVAWQERQGSYDTGLIRARRLTAAAEAVDVLAIAVNSDPGGQLWPEVGYAGGTWLVAWRQPSQASSPVRAARVSAAGSVLDSSPLELGSAQGISAVESDGQTFMVIASGDGFDAVRVDPDANILGSLFVVVNAEIEVDPAVEFIGDGPLALWMEVRDFKGDIGGGRLGTDGAVLDGPGIVYASGTDDQRSPALARFGGGGMAVWLQPGTNGRRVFSTPLAADGTPAAPSRIISNDDDLERSPDIACGPDACLVAWGVDETHDPPVNLQAIRGVRIDGSGAVLDALELDLALGDGLSAPAVARGASEYLVTWADAVGVRVRRVATTGQVLDDSPPVLELGGQVPAVEFGGDLYLVAWASGSRIHAVRVDPSGQVNPPTVDLGAGWSPAVARYGDGFLVVWQDANGVMGGRVTADGQVVDPDGFPIANAGASPAVASGPDGRTVVAYERYECALPYNGTRVFARFVGSELANPGGACHYQLLPVDCTPDPPPSPPDAGVPPYSDAAPASDAGVDAGAANGGGGGCCRASARQDPFTPALAILVLLLSLGRRRPQ